MSTTAVSTPTVEDITKTNVTYVIVRDWKLKGKTDENGHPVNGPDGVQVQEKVFGDWKSVPETDDTDKQIASGELEEKFRQTYTLPEVNTLQGCRNLVPDDEEFVNIFSAGLNQKMKNRARTMGLTKDFVPVQGVIDLTDKANEKSERQRLSPAEKLARTLADLFPNLSVEMRQQLIAQAQQQAGQ